MAKTAQTEIPGGPKEAGFPAFRTDTYPSQILWLVLAFGALYVVMARVALPRIAAILETRRATVTNDIEAAGQLKAETDAAIAAYEKALMEAKGRAQTIAAENRDRLGAEMDAKRKALEADLAEKLTEAEKTIGASKQAAMANVAQIAGDATEAIVKQVSGESVPRASIDAAVAKAV
jgi:F-type H+-transporting ATPase subunit b